MFGEFSSLSISFFTSLSNELTSNTFTNDVMEHILDHDDRKEIESKFSLHKYELSENVQ